MKHALFTSVTLLPALLLAPLAVLRAAESEVVRPGFRLIETMAELRRCMTTDGHKVRMKPGLYRVTDTEADRKTVFRVSGSNNVFDLRGVTIQLDTHLLAGLRGKTHQLATYRVTGSGNLFEGGTFENLGEEPPYTSLSEFSLTGDGMVFQDCTFIIRGSAPYGYGDCFGKGRQHKVNLQKHAAMSVVGDNIRISGCRFYIHTFGHAIHMHGAQNTFIKDVTIEGALRLSDEILAETSGLAVKLGFKDVYDRPIGKGKMICLAEDGIRAYLDGERHGKTRRTGDITVEGCTVKRMRGGIALSLASGRVTVRDCVVTESGYPGCAYSVPSKGSIRNCRGDAAYTPLLHLGYSHKSSADIELELLDAPRYTGNDLLALLNGSYHKIKITKPDTDSKPLPVDLKIVCGQTYRADEEDVGKTSAKSITLDNQTRQPVLLTDLSSGCTITSQGAVTDRGSGNKIIRNAK